jgi:hypothetical protein
MGSWDQAPSYSLLSKEHLHVYSLGTRSHLQIRRRTQSSAAWPRPVILNYQRPEPRPPSAEAFGSACPSPGGGSGGRPSYGDRNPVSQATICSTQHASIRRMLKSNSSGTHAHRHKSGHGQTRQAIAPAIPHRNGGANECPPLWPRRTAIAQPMNESQLSGISSADGTARISVIAQSSTFTRVVLLRGTQQFTRRDRCNDMVPRETRMRPRSECNGLFGETHKSIRLKNGPRPVGGPFVFLSRRFPRRANFADTSFDDRPKHGVARIG